MNLGAGLRIALTISAIAHALLWVFVAWPGAEPFVQAAAPIEVEIVSADELKEASKAQPQPNVDLPEVTASAASEGKSESKIEPKSEAKSEPKSELKPELKSESKPVPPQPQNQAQQRGQPPAPNAPSAPQAASSAPQAAQSAPQAEPSAPAGGWLASALSMPPTATSPFDVAESAANLSKDEVLAFKAHLQKCWNPPARSAEIRNLVVVLRVSFQPNGALAGEPSLLAASASSDGPALIQAATRALHECQPYGFLPAAKYKEWKSLDLSFSPTGLSALPTL